MSAQNRPDKSSATPPDMSDEIAALRDEIARLNAHRLVRISNSPWRFLMMRFISGLATGLGTVIGATFLVSGLVWWLQGIDWVPVIGEWAAEIATRIQEDLPRDRIAPAAAEPAPAPDSGTMPQGQP
ncbi:DUF5665 domain-containing protein [Palleronia sp. KMU-117]|uniref:DUF5665 domain-containing protein n=1 Tax=Palleronia sp. KMU-117 TaxID=3434108 RepID=UPI003D75A863